MNEKLICLLKASKEHALDYREILRGRSGGIEEFNGITNHIELLKSAINVMEQENMNLASGPREGQSGRVSERDELRDEMCRLTHDLRDVRVELIRAAAAIRSASGFATKCDLKELGDKIMSAIGDWAAKAGPKLDKIQAGLDVVQDLVEKLQNTSGAITAEDQALLDAIEQKIDAIATDADSVPTPPAPTPGTPA